MYLKKITVEAIPIKSRLCIWGTGTKGRMIYEHLAKHRPDISVIAFGDTHRAGTFLDRDERTNGCPYSQYRNESGGGISFL